MKQLALRCLLSVVLGLIGFGVLPGNAHAKGMDSDDSNSTVISGGGGIFYPFQGKTGFNAVIQMMGKNSLQERFGIELEFRKYQAEFFNAKNIDTRSYIIRGLGQYYFFPGGISPYVGLGINLAVNDFDGDEVEKKRPSIDVKTGWGIGYGIMGSLGVEVPLNQQLAFFAEGRVSGDFQVTIYEKRSGKDKINFESLSGLTGMGGIRMSF